MNKDKAIQLLERLQDPEPYEPMLTKDAYDAIQMAIDALSADGNTISRKAVLDALDEIEAEVADGYGYQYAKWREYFAEMPPAQPEVLACGEGELSAQPEIIRCKDCKHWIPYDWMFSEVWQSKNIADYPEDEIGCNFCDVAMKANDFCSRAERKTNE